MIFRCTSCPFETINHPKFIVHLSKHSDSAVNNTSSDLPANVESLERVENDDAGTPISIQSDQLSDGEVSTTRNKIKVKSDFLLHEPTLFVGHNINM